MNTIFVNNSLTISVKYLKCLGHLIRHMIVDAGHLYSLFLFSIIL